MLFLFSIVSILGSGVKNISRDDVFEEPVHYYPEFGITLDCLQCICEGASYCDMSFGCVADVCGPFKITYPYWKETQPQPLLGNSRDRYQMCTKDIKCATKAVSSYMKKLATNLDCNNDGKTDCHDYAKVHRLGHLGCKGPILDTIFNIRFERCWTNVLRRKPHGSHQGPNVQQGWNQQNQSIGHQWPT